MILVRESIVGRAKQVLVLSLLLVGCGSTPQPTGGGPTVVLKDSVALRENDSTFLADVSLIDVDGSGAMLLADDFHKRVWLVGQDGELRRAFGAKGEGPGELLLLGAPLFLGDSMVAVADNRRRIIEIFDRESGEFRRQIESPGIVYDGEWRDGQVWLGALDRISGTGVARWDIGTDSASQLVPMPDLYGASQRWAGMNTLVSVDEWHDTLFVGFSGDNTLLITDTNGAVLRRIEVPLLRRRGVPTDILAQIEAASPARAFGLYSVLFALHRLSSGEIALVHFDQTLQGRQLSADVYLSVISADRSRACVDGTVPVRRHTQPALAWRGDDLVIAEQVVVDSMRAITMARTYEIRLGGCDWIPVQQDGSLEVLASTARRAP